MRKKERLQKLIKQWIIDKKIKHENIDKLIEKIVYNIENQNIKPMINHELILRKVDGFSVNQVIERI